MADLLQTLLQESLYTPNDDLDITFQTLLSAPVPSLTFDASPMSMGSPDLANTLSPNMFFIGSNTAAVSFHIANSDINSLSPLSDAELDQLLANETFTFPELSLFGTSLTESVPPPPVSIAPNTSSTNNITEDFLNTLSNNTSSPFVSNTFGFNTVNSTPNSTPRLGSSHVNSPLLSNISGVSSPISLPLAASNKRKFNEERFDLMPAITAKLAKTNTTTYLSQSIGDVTIFQRGQATPLRQVKNLSANDLVSLQNAPVSIKLQSVTNDNTKPCKNRNDSNKRFSCDQCPSKFTRRYDLVRHLRVHFGIRPFGCDLCGKRFSRHDALNRHVLENDTTCKTIVNNAKRRLAA